MTNLFGLPEIIEKEDWAPLDRMFEQENYPAPRLLWNPSRTELTHESLRTAFDFWNGLRDGGSIPDHRSIDPNSFRPYLGLVTVLEPANSGSDFRFRLYGSKVADLAGFEMNGKLVSEMKATALMTAFVIAGHVAVSRRRLPLISVHEPPVTSNVSSWTRLILPFAGDDGAIVRILVMNQPGDLREFSPERLPRYYRPLID